MTTDRQIEREGIFLISVKKCNSSDQRYEDQFRLLIKDVGTIKLILHVAGNFFSIINEMVSTRNVVVFLL